jgi:hypothetical protein
LSCKAVAGCAVTPSFDNGFGVDSCASDHICHDKGMFTTLDFSKYKTFEVVHGETITSSGVGNVDLRSSPPPRASPEYSLFGTCATSPSRACLWSLSTRPSLAKVSTPLTSRTLRGKQTTPAPSRS